MKISEEIYKEMDPEVVPLVRAINKFNGITTTESCCGHGEKEFRIFFEADRLNELNRFAQEFTYSARDLYWNIMVSHTETYDHPHFYVQSLSVGPVAYEEANIIAQRINSWFLRQEQLEYIKKVEI